MLKKKTKFFFIFLSLFIIPEISFSIATKEPNIFVQSTVNRASQILSDSISKSEKIEKLKLVAKDTVDIDGIGFYTLFRKVQERTK